MGRNPYTNPQAGDEFIWRQTGAREKVVFVTEQSVQTKTIPETGSDLIVTRSQWQEKCQAMECTYMNASAA